MLFYVSALFALSVLSCVRGQYGIIDYNIIRSLVNMQVLNSSDACIPEEVKNQIRNCWTHKGVEIYRECSNNNSSGPYYDPYSAGQQMIQCVGKGLLEMKDVAVGEMMDIAEKMLTQKGMVACVGADLTVDMLWCLSQERLMQQMAQPNAPTYLRTREEPMISYMSNPY